MSVSKASILFFNLNPSPIGQNKKNTTSRSYADSLSPVALRSKLSEHGPLLHAFPILLFKAKNPAGAVLFFWGGVQGNQQESHSFEGPRILTRTQEAFLAFNDQRVCGSDGHQEKNTAFLGVRRTGRKTNLNSSVPRQGSGT